MVDKDHRVLPVLRGSLVLVVLVVYKERKGLVVYRDHRVWLECRVLHLRLEPKDRKVYKDHRVQRVHKAHKEP